MERASGGGASTRKSDEPTEAVVDGAYEAQIEYYYYDDFTINKTSQMLGDAVFRNSWVMRWGGSLVMNFFKVPMVKRAYERLLRDIRDMVRLKRYAGIYVYKDMAAWMQEFEASMRFTNGVPALAEVLPFGLVTQKMGRYVEIAPRGPYSATRVLHFEPVDEELASVYKFAVFNRGARFYDLNASPAGVTGSGQLGAGAWSSGPSRLASMTQTTIRPVTPVAELYEKKSKLEEAEHYQFNTAFAQAFPLSYMTAVAMPSEPVDELTDDVLAQARDMQEARTKSRSLHSMKVTFPQAIQMAKAMQKAMKSATGQQVDMEHMGGAMESLTSPANATVRRGLADRFGRVDPSENLIPVADFVTVNKTHNPTASIDVAQLRMQYEMAVCRFMDVPLSFYRTEIESSGNSSGASNMVLSESIISTAIADEQGVYREISDWVYMNSLAVLDRQLFKAVADDVDAMSDAEVAGDDAKRVLGFLTNMATRGESYAQLEFELLTVTNTESLQAMIEAQQMQLVSRQLVERNAARLFGHALGKDPSHFVTRPDASLRTNFNAPLLPPVSPDTSAKINSDKQRDKAKEPPAKKQKTAH